jgi:Ras family
MVDDKLVTMQIWDTAGQERFQSLGVAFYRWVMLSITDKAVYCPVINILRFVILYYLIVNPTLAIEVQIVVFLSMMLIHPNRSTHCPPGSMSFWFKHRLATQTTSRLLCSETRLMLTSQKER